LPGRGLRAPYRISLSVRESNPAQRPLGCLGGMPCVRTGRASEGWPFGCVVVGHQMRRT
jgi:hypothetical protein